MKNKLIMSLVMGLTLSVSALCNVANASELAEKTLKHTDRGTVVNITATIEYPDGTVRVHTMDTCTPGGFYNGIDAIVFGDSSIEIFQAGYAAKYPQHGDIVNQMWTNKADADDPWKPTYLLIKNPNSGFSEHVEEQFTSSSRLFDPSALKNDIEITKVITIDDRPKAPMLISVCGGRIHN